MITTVVGKTFLKAYNEKYGKALSPKEFFEQEYWELFFNHPKYMQWVTNSPFVQMKGGQKPHLLKAEERLEKLENLFEKVDEGVPDASFALGYPASESKEYASTSGQVSDLEIPTVAEDVYLSWIGSGLGLGVSGGYSILFDDPMITLQTYEGWKVYRKYLNDAVIEKLPGNKINTWNGQWLTYSLNDDFREDFEFSDLEDQSVFSSKESSIDVNTVQWSRLYFSVSRYIPDVQLLGYVYSFGQMNKTIGFIPFQFKSAKNILDIYEKLFGQMLMDKRHFESMFGMHIKRACELGSIGIQALRPDGLKKIMDQGKSISFKKEEDTYNYHAYKTWLVAMLSKNKEEMLTYSEKMAQALIRYRDEETGTQRRNFLEQEKGLLNAYQKIDFLDKIQTIIKETKLDKEEFKKLRDDVYLMSNEDYKYLRVLIKFDYSYYTNK